MSGREARITHYEYEQMQVHMHSLCFVSDDN